MTWHQARVVKSLPAATDLAHLSLEVPPEVQAGFEHPGQWVQLSVSQGVSGTFAIASAPGKAPFEFLVKRGPAVANALHALKAGDAVSISTVGGQGFPLQRATGLPLLLICSGSGIAPMRSVILAVVERRPAYGSVTLLLGVRSAGHLAFENEFAQWEQAGVRVVTTLSQGDEAWPGRRGYVQLHLPDDALHEAVVFVAGQREMTQAVRAALGQRGVSAQQVFLNL